MSEGGVFKDAILVNPASAWVALRAMKMMAVVRVPCFAITVALVFVYVLDRTPNALT
ncbi:MAG TPA: hypothetical protein VFA89_02390 [Terriglobales bacterium]|nr:hypothetical protein [Terriglobales bacterium]